MRACIQRYDIRYMHWWGTIYGLLYQFIVRMWNIFCFPLQSSGSQKDSREVFVFLSFLSFFPFLCDMVRHWEQCLKLSVGKSLGFRKAIEGFIYLKFDNFPYLFVDLMMSLHYEILRLFYTQNREKFLAFLLSCFIL